MPQAPSLDVVYYGTDEPVPAPRTVRAGPVSASFDGGNLRYLKVGDVEIMRAVQFIVRDRNWGTYAPKLDNLTVEENGGGFRIAFDALCADAEQRLAYRAVIEGRSDRIVFSVRGSTLTPFVTNRTGFVVLHAVEGVAGAPCRVTHTDGRVEESRFPELIDPMQPFMDIRSIAHEPAPGLKVGCTMTGDVYEMEDQRNWSDASYKTYIRPLALPWPYELSKGTALEQSVTVEIQAPAGGGAGGGGGPVAVTLDRAAARPMPKLGLAVSPDSVAEALAHAALARAIGAEHLVCHVDLRDDPEAGLLRDYRALADALGAKLVLECVLPCAGPDGKPTADVGVMQADVARLRGLVEQGGARPDLVVANAACDLKSTLPGSVFPPCPTHAEIAAAIAAAFPGVPQGGGMLVYFTELNRKRPPTAPFAFITHSTCPIVHAGDDLSVMESLQALPSIMMSAQVLAGGLPYRIGPTAIGMRTNPYGAKTADNPAGGRVAMARNDPRQRGLAAAAWAIGYAARALAHGVDALCLDAPTGPFGAIHTRQPWPTPWYDDAANGAQVYPVFHALAGIGAAAGRAMPAVTAAPGRLQGFAALRGDGATDLWLANLTGEALSVDLAACGTPQSVALIDETTFAALCIRPDGFEGLAAPAGGAVLALRPFACARVRLAA
ncbi:MAG: hypothetical protein R3F55_05875 [Alphaproteobacteria bacterium]